MEEIYSTTVLGLIFNHYEKGMEEDHLWACGGGGKRSYHSLGIVRCLSDLCSIKSDCFKAFPDRLQEKVKQPGEW